MSDKLEDILVSGSDEKSWFFTDDSALMELSGLINLPLEGYQKIKGTTGVPRPLPRKCFQHIP